MEAHKKPFPGRHIIIRDPAEIYQIRGEISNGTFHGRWHFSFGDNYDPRHMQFGSLRVFNDDTLSPGAVWPLHPHYDIEVVTYCAQGEFRHADQRGKGSVLKKGWVQHTTVGRGMWHSEINNRSDAPMRFIQMWFIPDEKDLVPSVEQKAVQKKERTDRLLPLVAPDGQGGAFPIYSDARVYSCFLEGAHAVEHPPQEGRGAYIYVLEGKPVEVNGDHVPVLACGAGGRAADDTYLGYRRDRTASGRCPALSRRRRALQKGRRKAHGQTVSGKRGHRGPSRAFPDSRCRIPSGQCLRDPCERAGPRRYGNGDRQ